MKTNLNRVALAILAGLVLAVAPAFSQTSVKEEETLVVLADTPGGESAAPGSLVLGAGGTRRVVARVGLAGPNMLRLQLANLQEYRTHIILTAPAGTVLWEEEFSNQAAFAKHIDLKTLMPEPGTYSLWVQAGEAFLEQKIVVKNHKATLGALRYGAVATNAAMAKN